MPKAVFELGPADQQLDALTIWTLGIIVLVTSIPTQEEGIKVLVSGPCKGNLSPSTLTSTLKNL